MAECAWAALTRVTVMTGYRVVWPGALGWLLGVAAALTLFSVVVLSLGRDPREVLGGLVTGALGSPAALNRTVARVGPLLLLSAGLLLAFRARFWNIGLNGGMVMGAIAASGVALYGPSGAAWITLPAMLIAALAAGCAWS